MLLDSHSCTFEIRANSELEWKKLNKMLGCKKKSAFFFPYCGITAFGEP